MIAAVNILLLCYHLSFRCTAKSQGEKTLALSLYGVSPVPLGQFTSVTYPRRTGGKRLDKNRMPIRAFLFEIQDVVHVVNSWIFFLTLVDICGICFCRPALKSHQNVVQA